MTKLLVVSALVAAPAFADPALAMQTEVDPGFMQWKRGALAAWNRKVEREARLDSLGRSQATGIAASEGSQPSEAPSGGVLSAEQVAAYARGAGFPEDVIPTMV